MMDMGEASYVLRIKITRHLTFGLLYLDQSKYIEKVLKRFNMRIIKYYPNPYVEENIWIELCVLKINKKISIWT